MTLDDFLFHLVWDVTPIVALFCVVLGAALLWRFTRRASSLLQLVASVFLFFGIGLHRVRWQLVTPYDNSVFADVLRSEALRVAMLIAQSVGFALFAASYLWYARGQRRI